MPEGKDPFTDGAGSDEARLLATFSSSLAGMAERTSVEEPDATEGDALFEAACDTPASGFSAEDAAASGALAGGFSSPYPTIEFDVPTYTWPLTTVGTGK